MWPTSFVLDICMDVIGQKISNTNVNCFRPITSMQLFQKMTWATTCFIPNRDNKIHGKYVKNAFIFPFSSRIGTQVLRQRLGELSLFCSLIFFSVFASVCENYLHLFSWLLRNVYRKLPFLSLLSQDDKHSWRTRSFGLPMV